jgi:hypothetical protein
MRDLCILSSQKHRLLAREGGLVHLEIPYRATGRPCITLSKSAAEFVLPTKSQ